MGIFSDIMDKIFHHGKPAAPAAAPAEASPTEVAVAAPAAPTPMDPVDVAAMLDALKAQSGQELNWRVSIVDMMKLLDLDSSLGHRKALAAELNYTGDTNDSASMNIWLHGQVMTKLSENGGIVPSELKA